MKNVIFHSSHMPMIDLNPVCENLEQFLKTDLVQPTPTCNHSGIVIHHIPSILADRH